MMNYWRYRTSNSYWLCAVIATVLLTICATCMPQRRAVKRQTGVRLAAAVEADNCSLVMKLLDHGANPNANDRYGHPLITCAALQGCAKCVAHLLDSGAKVDAPATGNETALMLAAAKAKPVVVRLLIRRGASIKLRNVNGYTPLGLCLEKNAYPTGIKQFDKPISDTLRLLRRAGARL